MGTNAELKRSQTPWYQNSQRLHSIHFQQTQWNSITGFVDLDSMNDDIEQVLAEDSSNVKKSADHALCLWQGPFSSQPSLFQWLVISVVLCQICVQL